MSVEHKDKVGRVIRVGDVVMHTYLSGRHHVIRIGIITKILPKTVAVNGDSGYQSDKCMVINDQLVANDQADTIHELLNKYKDQLDYTAPSKNKKRPSYCIASEYKDYSDPSHSDLTKRRFVVLECENRTIFEPYKVLRKLDLKGWLHNNTSFVNKRMKISRYGGSDVKWFGARTCPIPVEHAGTILNWEDLPESLQQSIGKELK